MPISARKNRALAQTGRYSYRHSAVASNASQVLSPSEPKSKLIYTFPGNWCGVPTIVGHYLIQSVPAVHGFIVLDIATADRPKEVSRLTLSDTFGSHWTGLGRKDAEAGGDFEWVA